MIVTIAILLGLFGGLGLGFFAEYFDHSINSPAELERLTGFTALGSLRKLEFVQPKKTKPKKPENQPTVKYYKY